jgi:hypothetical protein
MTLPDILGCHHSVGAALYLWEYLLCNTNCGSSELKAPACTRWISAVSIFGL